MTPDFNQYFKKNRFTWIIVALFIFLSFPRLIGFFIIIGLLLYLTKYFKKQGQHKKIIDINTSSIYNKLTSSMRKIIIGVIAVIVLLIILSKSIVIIPAGFTGVYQLFGKVSDRVLSSGIHLINPIAHVEKMSIRTEEFSMVKTQEGGSGDSIAVLTKEGLDVGLDVTILYRLSEAQAATIYKNFGLNYRDTIIRPMIRSSIRQVISEFEAKDIYSEKRSQVVNNLKTLLTDELGKRGIILEDVLLRDVQLPQRLTQSIQDKLTAEQDAQRYNFLLDQAKKEADRLRIEAAGQRDAQRTINESLTPNYLNYQYIQSLKDRAGTIYVPVNPQNGMPLFQNVGK